MRRRTRAGLPVLLAVGAFTVLATVATVATGGTAHADSGESISRYTITYEVNADGVVHVEEEFGYDFGPVERHGPERLITTREQVGDSYRISHVRDVAATSATGAPAAVDVAQVGDRTRIRVGDPGRVVTGEQEYTLEYDLVGALNEVDGHGELYWDAAGPNWEVPIDDLTVTVTAPGGVTRQRCLFGVPGSSDSCTGSEAAGGEAVFEQDRVEPGEVLTVVAGFALDEVVVPDPVYQEREEPAGPFALTPRTAGLSAAILAVCSLPLGLVLLRRRRRRYAGLPPGEIPPAGVRAAVERAPREGVDKIAVRPAPPDGISPGEAGLLLRRKHDTADTTATLVDLAVRGYLRIENPAGPWTLAALRPPGAELRPHEQALLRALFATAATVRLDRRSKAMVNAVKGVETALSQAVVERGWFKKMSRRRRVPVVLGCVLVWFGLAVVGFPAAFLVGALVLRQQLGPVVLAGVAGVALLVAAAVLRRYRQRTPDGYAAYHQVAGFRRHLATAEAERLRFEDGDNVFGRWLPWAIGLDVTSRWAYLGEQLARQGRIAGDVDWYRGPGPWSYTGFAGSVGALTIALHNTGGPRSGLSGSSSSGGGFSSGGSAGGGGGGGGSW